jgi:VCBS repeat protein
LTDVNRDGKADLVATGGDGLRVLLGDGGGAFKAAPGSPFSVGKGSWRLVVGDLNRDGMLNVATSGVEDNTVTVLLQR